MRCLHILLSGHAASSLHEQLAATMGGRPVKIVIATSTSPSDATPIDIAFVSRDVTARSTKQELEAGTAHFYALLRESPTLQWVHTHSAGADRPIFQELLARGVRVTTSAGSNASVVAHTALAGLLSLARGFPSFARAQSQRRWASLAGGPLPRDLCGQRALIVGWGGIGQLLGRYLQMLGLTIAVVRRSTEPAAEGVETVGPDALHEALPRADWLILACPLNDRTRRLIDARALAALPPTAHLVNVARGEVVDEAALVDALTHQRLAGAYLDVFEHEPLAVDSPLWALPNVILSPHSAGFSDGNEARVAARFIDNLGRWLRAAPLHHEERRQ